MENDTSTGEIGIFCHFAIYDGISTSRIIA